jgi:hypothetical protein
MSTHHDDPFADGPDEYADFVPSRAADFEGSRSNAIAGLARLTTGIPHVCIITTITARTTARHRIVSVGLVSLTQPGEGNMVEILTSLTRPGASDKPDWGAVKLGKLASKGSHIAATEETCVHVYEGGKRKADADNYLKIVGDALNGLGYTDDVQVTSAFVTVERESSEPRIEIRLYAL